MNGSLRDPSHAPNPHPRASTRIRCPRRSALALAAVLAAGAVPAQAQLVAEAFVAHRGAPAGEYAGWDGFVSPVGGSNLPDDPATSSGAAFDLVQLDPGAMLTGGNLYGLGGAMRFELSHTPAASQAAADLTRTTLQLSTLGSELDYASVALEYTEPSGTVRRLAPSRQEELVRYPLGGFGDGVETLFEWDLAGEPDPVAAYRLVFATSAAHASLDAVRVDALWADAPFRYCASAGTCAASVAWSGVPAASSSFVVSANGVPAGSPGLLFYSTAGAKQTPFKGGLGGWRCVRGPLRRTPVQTASGTGACGGVLSFDFASRLSSDPALAPHAAVYAQYWFLDPASPSGSSTSDALQFFVQP